MITFEDIKRVIEALPYGIDDVKETDRMVEDLDLDEEDAIDILNYIQMQLEVEFPDDDAFVRFAAHLPLKELVRCANEEHEDPFL